MESRFLPIVSCIVHAHIPLLKVVRLEKISSLLDFNVFDSPIFSPAIVYKRNHFSVLYYFINRTFLLRRFMLESFTVRTLLTP